MKNCGVYATESDVYVVSLARTIPGFELVSEPMFKARRDEPSALGEAVLSALNAYKEGVAAPDPRAKIPSPFLKYSGFRSWKAVERSALHLSVRWNGPGVSIIPTVRDEHAGYAHKPDLAVTSSPEPSAIGEALLKALALCK